MKLIDQLFQQCYKEGISREDFLQHLGAEAHRLLAIARHDGQFPQSSQNNYQRIKDGELTISMGYILKALYGAKRETVNTTSQEGLTQRHEDMLTAIQNDTLMELQDQEKGPVRGSEITHDSSERSFIHRLPKNRRQNGWSRGNHRFGRFSVNADMNPDLIKDLDKFCSTHKCYYKTCCPTDWDKRVDPVTVYVFEPITEDLKKEFTNLIGKYVRNSRSDLNELLDGNTLIPGVTYDRDWSYDEGMKFINSLPPFLREGALDFTSTQRKTRKAMSLGYRTTIEDFYRLYQQYEPKFQKVSTAENTSFKVTSNGVENDRAIVSYSRQHGQNFVINMVDKKSGDVYSLKNETPDTWSLSKNGEQIREVPFDEHRTHDFKNVSELSFLNETMQRAVAGIAGQHDNAIRTNETFMKTALRRADLEIPKEDAPKAELAKPVKHISKGTSTFEEIYSNGLSIITMKDEKNRTVEFISDKQHSGKRPYIKRVDGQIVSVPDGAEDLSQKFDDLCKAKEAALSASIQKETTVSEESKSNTLRIVPAKDSSEKSTDLQKVNGIEDDNALVLFSRQDRGQSFVINVMDKKNGNVYHLENKDLFTWNLSKNNEQLPSISVDSHRTHDFKGTELSFLSPIMQRAVAGIAGQWDGTTYANEAFITTAMRRANLAVSPKGEITNDPNYLAMLHKRNSNSG